LQRLRKHKSLVRPPTCYRKLWCLKCMRPAGASWHAAWQAPPAPPQATSSVAPAEPQSPPAPPIPAPPAPAPSTPPAPTAIVPPPVEVSGSVEVATPATPEKILPPEWPFKGFTGCQPWEAENPPTITHDRRMLTSGTNGPEVAELGALLGVIGYPNPITAGQNPHAIYDTELAAAVRQFCSEFGVSEDPAIVAAMTADVVGPWIWEALNRAARKAAS